MASREHVTPRWLYLSRLSLTSPYAVHDISPALRALIMQASSRSITSSFHFLQKLDIYTTVEPYGTVFSSGKPAESNLRSQIEESLIEDARGASLSIMANGFEILNFSTSMQYEQWAEQSVVENMYCNELGSFLLKHLGATSVQIFDAQVRLYYFCHVQIC